MTPHDLLRVHPILGALTDGEAQALRGAPAAGWSPPARLSSSVTTLRTVSTACSREAS